MRATIVMGRETKSTTTARCAEVSAIGRSWPMIRQHALRAWGSVRSKFSRNPLRLRSSSPTILPLDGSTYYQEESFTPIEMDCNRLSEYHDYPATAIRAASFHFGVPADHVFAYSGSTDLIYLLFSSYSTRNIHFLHGEFPVYKYALSRLSIPWSEIPTTQSTPYALLDQLTLPRNEPNLLMISRPNSLYGFSSELSSIASFLGRNQGTLVVVDEAYQAFSSRPSAISLLGHHANLVCLRTASKEFSLPALRVAWLLTGNKTIISHLSGRTYNTVSHPAEIIVDDIVVRQRQRHTRNLLHLMCERRRIERALDNSAIRLVAESHTCQVFVEMPSEACSRLKALCADAGIDPLYLNDVDIYKDALFHPNSSYIRFNVWSRAVNDRVIETLNAV